MIDVHNINMPRVLIVKTIRSELRNFPFYLKKLLKIVIVIQVLQDGRLVDLPLSDTFLRIMCGEELSAIHVVEVDPSRHK